MLHPSEIDDFFNRYGSMMNNALFGDMPDMAFVAGCFASSFVNASPYGVVSAANDETFVRSIRESIEFYKRIGVASMNMLSKEITVLDDLHAMVKVHWNCLYNYRDESGEMTYDVIYFVQSRERAVRIFAYITGDEQQALLDHGLIE